MLTKAFKDHFVLEKILGIDVDSNLIDAAKEKFKCKSIDFQQCDFIQNLSVAEDYLKDLGVDKFDVVFVFSVSMWIHLNHGETGLQRLFENCQRLTKTGGLLVLEPQPWKCYMTAARRMRKLNQPKFEHLESISHRQDKLLPHIIKTCETAGFKLVCTLGETHWKRPIYLFKSS